MRSSANRHGTKQARSKIEAMVTKSFEIQGLFGALDHLAIEKKLRLLAGVGGVAVNAASTTASITYDETKTAPEHITHAIKECGFHCTGVALPAHICTPETPAAKHVHADHTAHKPDPHASHAAHDPTPTAEKT